MAHKAEAAIASSTRTAPEEGERTLVNQFTVPWHLATNMARGWWAGSLGARSALRAVVAPENERRGSTGLKRWGRAWCPRTRT